MAETTTKTGSCHCGAVKFKVTGTFDTGMACNCSLCGRSGHVLTFVPVSQFELLSGADALSDYQFGKKRLHHPFCRTCGIRTFSRGIGPNGQEMVAVNLRCVEGVEMDKLQLKHFDGKSLPLD